MSSLCFRVFKCQNISPERVEDFFQVVEDRLRIPWFNGKGAMKVKSDLALPVVIVPLGLLVATINFYCTLLFLFCLPIAMLGFYQLWLRRPMKSRTKVFYYWGMTSVFCMYYLFEFAVVPFREILLLENMLVSSLFGLTMLCFYRCKKGPGVVTRTKSQDASVHNRQTADQIQDTYSKISKAMEAQQQQYENDDAKIPSAQEITDNSPTAQMLMQNFGMDKQALMEKAEESREEVKGHIISADSVTWVDSRMTRGEKGYFCCMYLVCQLYFPVVFIGFVCH